MTSTQGSRSAAAKPILTALTAALLAGWLPAAQADTSQEALVELLRKQSEQLDKLQAELQQLRDRVNRQEASAPPAAPAAANTSAAAPARSPSLVAPPAAHSGLLPDVTIGRVVTRLRGDAVVEVGHTTQNNDADMTSTAARERFRLIVNPDVQAGDGFSYGALVRYVVARGDQSVNAPDRGFAYVRGPYGEFSAGVRNGYGDESYFPFAMDYLPTGRFDAALGFMVPGGGIVGGAQGTDALGGRYQGADVAGGVVGALNATNLIWPALAVDNSATKLMYVSPRFAGLRFGADWTPRNDAFHISTNRLDYTTSTTLVGTGFNAVFRNLIEAGVDYDQRFGGVRALANLVYATGQATPTTTAADSYRKLEGYQAGVRGEYNGFALGATALYLGKSGQQINSTGAAPRFQANTYNYSLHGQYKQGRWVFGGVYRYGQDPGQMALAGVRQMKLYELGLGYTLWDGLQLQFQIDRFVANSDKAETATSGSPNDRGTVAIARAVFRF